MNILQDCFQLTAWPIIPSCQNLNECQWEMIGTCQPNPVQRPFAQKPLKFIPKGWLTKMKAAVVSLYTFWGIRQKFMSCSQWIRVIRLYWAFMSDFRPGSLFIFNYSTKLTCCWIKCRFSKLPEALCCTVTWHCRCAKSSEKKKKHLADLAHFIHGRPHQNIYYLFSCEWSTCVVCLSVGVSAQVDDCTPSASMT